MKIKKVLIILSVAFTFFLFLDETVEAADPYCDNGVCVTVKLECTSSCVLSPPPGQGESYARICTVMPQGVHGYCLYKKTLITSGACSSDCDCTNTCPPSCTPGCDACARYDYLQAAYTTYGTKNASCVDACGVTQSKVCYCNSQCTPPSCPVGTSTTGSYGYKTTVSCTNNCGMGDSKDCYCTIPCPLSSCPSQYSPTNLGFGSLVYDRCTNSCGQSRTQTCYCKPCTPDPCPSQYSTTNQGYGSLVYDTCTNQCGNTNTRTCYCNQCTISCPTGTSLSGGGQLYLPKPKCTNNCGVSRTLDCRYDCHNATCTNLESKVNWTDSVCLESEKDCRITRDRIIPTNNPSPGCDTQQIKTCYIRNTPPESPDKNNEENNLDVLINLEGVLGVNTYGLNDNILEKFVRKIRAKNLSNVLGYESNTHTGTQLNNPLSMTVQYSDEDGLDDVEALYIWFSTSSTKEDFITPNRIANPTENLTGMTENNENFGFMMTKNESGQWKNIYRPHINGGKKAWVQEKNPSPTSITILGSNGDPMVGISSVDVTEIEDDGGFLHYFRTPTIVMSFNMLFMWEGTHEKVENGQYKIWALANDSVGFLPFGEFDDIEDSENEYWKYSGTDWAVDLEKPLEVNRLSSSNASEQEISMRFNVKDNESKLSRVRLDACRSGGDESPPNDLLVGAQKRPYTLQYCSDIDWSTLNMANGNNLLAANPVNPNASTYSIDGVNETLIIDLNDNSNGSITFRLTFMDEAGNWAQSVYTHNLGEWVAVKDALVFGEKGVSSSTRELDTEWILNPISAYGFEESTIDLTDQILLGGKGSVIGFLGDLRRDSVNKSFAAANFGGIFIASPYPELVRAYKDRMQRTGDTLDYQEVELDKPDLPRDITSLCTEEPEICILHRSGDLNISTGSVCKSNALLIASGDITIDPDFKNNNDSSACIIVANGNIIIDNGETSNNNLTVGGVNYDVIEAFLIAGGEIIIESDSRNDGLMVEGGLAAFTPASAKSAVNNQRKISLSFRNTHPVIAVKGNAKYGLLGKKLFGSQTSIFQVYIGFKPY